MWYYKPLMNNTTPTIRLNKTHLKRASMVCASAFHNYPHSINLIPDEKKRRRILPHIFEYCINYGLLYGEVHAVSQNLEGVAVWLPASEADISIFKLFKAGFLSMSGKVGPGILMRLISGLNHSTGIMEKHASDTDWILFQLAVNPFCQGKGHGRALLNSMLKRIDKHKHSCCLDTHDEKNVNIYKRYGFKVVYSGTVPHSNTSLWTMVRRLPA